MSGAIIYRNFVVTGEVSNLGVHVVVPREREEAFLQQFPGSKLDQGFIESDSFITVEQIEAAVQKLQKHADETVEDVAYMADLVQFSRARNFVERTQPPSSPPPFSPETSQIIDKGACWTGDYENHWQNKGVGGFQGFYFHSLRLPLFGPPGERIFRVFRFKEGEKLECVDLTEEQFAIAAFGDPSNVCTRYQYRRYVAAERAAEAARNQSLGQPGLDDGPVV